jgi:hypothetical protein
MALDLIHGRRHASITTATIPILGARAGNPPVITSDHP